MAYLFALTIPGLATALVVLGVVDVMLVRHRGTRLLGRGRAAAFAPVAYDEATALFTPGKRLELEERHSVSMLRQAPDDGAPPRSRLDLDRGTASLVLAAHMPT